MSRRFIIWTSAILLVSFSLITVSYCGYRKLDSLDSLADVIALVREDFPEVSHLGTDDLAKALADPAASELLLIDTREPYEFAISRIPGAENLDDPEAIAALVESRQPSTVVLYCSVGYRSSRLAKAVGKELPDSVIIHNLEGSIFQWANEDRPLESAEGDVTSYVHPYNRFWGRLLDPEHVAPEFK